MYKTGIAVLQGCQSFFAHFHSFSLICGNRDAVSSYFSQTHDMVYQYYQPIIKDCKKVMAVDLGWNGTCAIALKYLLEEKKHAGVQVLSALVGTKDGQEPTVRMAEEDLFVYGFSRNMNRDLQKKHMDKEVDYHNLLMEILFTAPEPSFLKFSCGPDGSVSPVYAEELEQNVRIAERIHRGILAFLAVMPPCAIFPRDSLLPVQDYWKTSGFCRDIFKNYKIQNLSGIFSK